MRNKIIIFTILSCAAKVIAFARELILAYCYGANTTSDIFLLSMTLPVTLFGLVSAGITPSFIPIYVAIKEKNKVHEALQFVNKVITILLIFCAILVLLYYFFSEPFIRILAKGFSDEAIGVSIRFTDISVLAIFFICITTVLTAYLQAIDRLTITALVSIPLNIGVIISIAAAFFSQDIFVLPVGFLIASLAQMGYMVFFACQEGFRYRLALGGQSEYVKCFMQTLAFLSLSGSINQINILIDRTLATNVIAGGLSVFEYGSRINDFIMGLTIVPISTAIFPEMAKQAANITELKKKTLEGVRFFLILLIPISTIVVIFSRPIVKSIYYRGAFNEWSLESTAQIVLFYGIGLIAYAYREVLAKVFYAVSDSKTPMINAVIGVVINIILNFVLFQMMGIGGLALATSISAFVCVFLFIISLNRRWGDFRFRSLFPISCKMAVISFLCGAAALFVYDKVVFMIKIEMIRLGISLLLFLFVFIGISIKANIIKREQLKSLIRLHHKKSI